jgi:calcineurin-like phosphoesterase
MFATSREFGYKEQGFAQALDPAGIVGKYAPQVGFNLRHSLERFETSVQRRYINVHTDLPRALFWA